MIQKFFNFFRQTQAEDDVEYILQPVQHLTSGQLLQAAIFLKEVFSEASESLRRLAEYLPDTPIDNKEALKVLVSVYSGLLDLSYQIESFLSSPSPEPDPTPPPQPEPEPTPTKSLRPGIWGINGQGSQEMVNKMLAWQPTAITAIFDHIGNNGLHQYKQHNPDAKIIIRFMHPKNWRDNITVSAKNYAAEIVSKWSVIEPFDYVYFANEINLHYENGDENAGHQHLYQTPEFYAAYADWFRIVCAEIKDKQPDMPLVLAPFAYGHNEDGEPDDDGKPKLGWSGYGLLLPTIQQYCDNTIAAHYYWGHGGGTVHNWLYHPEESTWHAFRWKRVFNLFEKHYGLKVKMIIDECGGFDADHPNFPDDIIYYSKKCLEDERIIAVTPFLWFDSTHQNGKFPNGNMANDWWYNIPPDRLDNLSQRLGGIP